MNTFYSKGQLCFILGNLLLMIIAGCVPRSNDPIQTVGSVDNDATLEYLDDLTARNPNNGRSYFKKAVIHQQKGNLQAALQSVDRAIQLEYSDPRFFLFKGEILTELHEPKAAIDLLLKAEAAGDRNRALYSLLARNYLELGQPLEARRAVDRLLKVDQGDLSQALAGQAYVELGDTLMAVRSFQEAIQLNPGNLPAYSGLINIYESNGEHSLAEAYLDKALGLDRNDLRLLKAKGRLLKHRAAYDSAIAIFKKVVRLAQDKAVEYLEVAAIYYEINRYDSAISYVDKTLMSRADDREALLLKARILDQSRNYREARSVYERILQKDSTNNLALTELDKLKRKVSYLQRLQRQRQALDSARDTLPPALNRKELEN